MKRLAVLMFVAVAFLFFGIRPGTLANQDKPMASDIGKQPDYFPIQLGNKWHVQIENGNGKKAEGTMEIVKVETVGGQKLAQLQFSMMGKKQKHDGEISTSEQGVFLHKLEPPVCLLKYPVKEGETWRLQIKNNGVEFLAVTTVGKWEQVEVPAGKFKAIKVRVEYDENVVPYSTVFWFVADVGVVMSTTSSLKGITTKLVKFEKASDKK